MKRLKITYFYICFTVFFVSIICCKSKQEKALEFLELAKKAEDKGGKYFYTAEAIKNDPELTEAYVIRGDLWAEGKGAVYDSALSNLNKALELEPENSLALAYRAAVNNALTEFKYALKDINKAIENKPDTFFLYKIRSDIFDNLGFKEKSKLDLIKAIEMNEKCSGCWFNLGILLYQNNNLDSAEYSYSKCLQSDPNYIPALINRGLLYASDKRFNKAIDDFTRAIETDSTYFECYKHRGTVFGFMDKNDLAIKDLRKYLEHCQEHTLEYFDIKTAISDLEKKIK